MDSDAHRGRVLVEESREAVVDPRRGRRGSYWPAAGLASRSRACARASRSPTGCSRETAAIVPLVVPYDVNGRRERLVYLSQAATLTAYEELRAGFTASVSHELRTPLARLLVAPGDGHAARRERPRARRAGAGGGGADPRADRRGDVPRRSSSPGHAVVSLGSVAVLPELEAVADELEGARARAPASRSRSRAIRGSSWRSGRGCCGSIAQNLAENAIRYAGPGATFTLAVERDEDGVIVVRGTDDGVGVDEAELTRLFERFFRADQARASRGTGLGLAIVKHIVTQAGGTVEARGGLGGRARDPLRLSRTLSARFTSSSPDVHQFGSPRH